MHCPMQRFNTYTRWSIWVRLCAGLILTRGGRWISYATVQFHTVELDPFIDLIFNQFQLLLLNKLSIISFIIYLIIICLELFE